MYEPDDQDDVLMQTTVNSILEDSDDEDGLPTKRLRFIRDRIPHFDDLDDRDFIIRFRLSKEIAHQLLTKIDDQLEFRSDKNASVSPINQLLLCLRFYATGCTQLAAGDFSGVSVSTANRIVHRVSKAITAMYKDNIYFPRNHEEMQITKMRFYQIARFPKVIGAIDCTHIKIASPGGDDAEHFRNRKGWFSLNVQGIVNADLEFTNIVARWPGSAADITIFDNSAVRTRLEQGEYGDALIVADSGYANRKYMMMPLDNPVSIEQIRYNESQIRTRNPVERIFGVWKRRFPVLALGLRTQLRNTLQIIVATAVLHNILRRNGEPDAPDDPTLTLPDNMPWDRLIAYGQIQPDVPAHNRRRCTDPHRQALIHDYFRTLTNMYEDNNRN